MAKSVIVDEIHMTLRIPNDLLDAEAEVIRRTLSNDDVMARLRRAVRTALRTFPELNVVRASLTR